MLLFLSDLHKEHLGLLKSQHVQVVVNFCKLAIDFLNNGINIEKYTLFGDRINLSVTSVEHIIHAIVYLLSEGCKHNLSEADFKATISMIEYNDDIQNVLTKLFSTKKKDISDLLYKLQQRDPVLEDFSWRFETQVASRRNNEEVKPMLTMDLILRNSKLPNIVDIPSSKNANNSTELIINNSIDNSKTASQCQNVISHTLLQSDLPNLINLTNKLEQALKESKSHNVRKVQRALQR